MVALHKQPDVCEWGRLSFACKLDFSDAGTEFLMTTVNTITAFAILGINHLKIKGTHYKLPTGVTECHLLARCVINSSATFPVF